MIGFKATVQGGDVFRSANPRGGITHASWAFMRKQGAIMLRHAKSEAPVGATHQLRDQHVLRVTDPFHAEVTTTATRNGFPYPVAVATGSRPHWPPPDSGLPFPVRRHIAMHGTKPNPWMARAYDASQSEISAGVAELAAQIAREVV